MKKCNIGFQFNFQLNWSKIHNKEVVSFTLSSIFHENKLYNSPSNFISFQFLINKKSLSFHFISFKISEITIQFRISKLYKYSLLTTKNHISNKLGLFFESLSNKNGVTIVGELNLFKVKL